MFFYANLGNCEYLINSDGPAIGLPQAFGATISDKGITIWRMFGVVSRSSILAPSALWTVLGRLKMSDPMPESDPRFLPMMTRLLSREKEPGTIEHFIGELYKSNNKYHKAAMMKLIVALAAARKKYLNPEENQ